MHLAFFRIFLLFFIFSFSFPTQAREGEKEFFVFEFIGMSQTSGGRAGVKSESLKLDRQTGKSPALSYFEQFNPPAVPYQRNQVFNHFVQEKGELLLVSRATKREKVQVSDFKEGFRRRSLDLQISLTGGALYAIPSDTPYMEIIGYESEPKTEFTFYKDENDLYYIMSEGGGDYKIKIFVQSPQDYGKEPVFKVLAKNATIDMGRQVREIIKLAIGETDLSRIVGTDRDLEGMYLYFQSFSSQALEMKAERTSLLGQILIEKKGLCRHRVFAFVALAQYLGIEARMVVNDAHAFAELYSDNRWQRLELGGEAEAFHISYADGREERRLEGASFINREQVRAELLSERVSGSEEVSMEGGKGRKSTVFSSDAVGESVTVLQEILARPRLRVVYFGQKQANLERGKAFEVFGKIVDEDGFGREGVMLELVYKKSSGLRRVLARSKSSSGGEFRFSVMISQTLPLGEAEILLESENFEIAEAE